MKGQRASGTAPGRASHRYRCRDLRAVPIGSHEELVSFGTGLAPVVVPAHGLELARRCDRFETLDGHALARGRELGLARREVQEIVRDLDDLAARGVLVSLEALVESCAEARRREPAVPRLGTIGVVTRDRPGALGRAIASHAAGLREGGREAEWLIVDDSRDAATRASTRALLRALAADLRLGLRYAGQEDKASFAAALAAETGVDEALIAFALFDPEGAGGTFGANRNALLLGTAGALLLSLDDDVVWRAAQVPGAGPGLWLDSGPMPWQWWFFRDRERVLGALEPGPADVVAVHEALLGRSPSACLGELAGSGHDLDRAGAALVGLLETGRGRVVLTMSGRAGDSGATDPVPLWLAGASRERLVASEEEYRSACTSRELIRGVTRATIGDRILCSTLSLGIDNRHVLPPFFPVGRSEDVAFGVAVRACLPGACVGCLPVAPLHAPVEPRAFAPGDVWRRAGAYRVTGLLMDCLGPLGDSLVGVEAPTRMRALGWRLEDLAGLSPAGFAAHVGTERRARGALSIATLEASLDACGEAPRFWAEDVRRHVAALGDALARDDVDVPHDLLSGREPAAARALAQRLVLRYAALLRAWPDLVEGARRLRARGMSLGEALG